ncbi:acetoin utilization protein AcuC [Tsukamurella sp. 8F]|uniref:acetoin utilization protein AcuC n=1 Tax=unclassified Tsukamurella TaxID=2633480 RepID=UPI0023B95043|nr:MULTISPECIES: acetoin utilization protein AcuC [unclassified Tsukamurella]MDF0532145.1 acetoin utilization protein AcuC [Tsukamurella sp. 8J]MDF0585186.1 acetoin utilization protein AcuC [Tsukamurella sp. 8F]
MGAGAGASVIWDPAVLGYRFSPSHPMDPIRLELTVDLARSLGVLDDVEALRPGPFDDTELLRIHSGDYIDAVRAAGRIGADRPSAARVLAAYGLGNDDNPIFAQVHEAAASIVGSTLAGAREIAQGRAVRAVSIAGGMHHAMRTHASGFCVYNDVAVAISWLLDNGFDRIAYIDVDAHHGDGVQAAFWDDPRVLTVSLHEDPRRLWPGTGYPSELGGPQARGEAVNVPVPSGCPDRLWLRAFDAVVPSVVRAYRPQIIVSQCGCDSHRTDPLTDLALTVDGQRAAVYAMRDLADELCDGRWLAVGGGGYQVVNVVPRIWTHLLAAGLGRDVAPETVIPSEWVGTVASHLPTRLTRCDPLPTTMGDGADLAFTRWEPGGDPADTSIDAVADRFVGRARAAVFPLHDLDPEDPRD